MKKIITNANKTNRPDIFAIATALSDATWLHGYFNHYAFEAKVDDIARHNGISAGRVMYLIITEKYYHLDNPYSTVALTSAAEIGGCSLTRPKSRK